MPERPGGRGRRWAAGAVAGVLAVAGIVLQGSSGSALAAVQVGVPSAVSDDGSRVVSETVVDAHMVDLLVHSTAMGRDLGVRLILPADWSSQPTRTWPSLWMFEGSGDEADFRGWTVHTALEAYMDTRDVLTVIPTDGPSGCYADWADASLTGQTQDWETFHTEELVQLMTRGYRADDTRVAAGDSIGGMGAFDYAARHPGLFKAAASLSGMLDISNPQAQIGLFAMQLRDGDTPFGPYGDPWHNPDVWAAHNPTALVAKLAGVALFVSSGNGLPGRYGWAPGGAVLEQAVYAQTKTFVRAAAAAGVPVTADFYGGGIHDWPYWQAEFPVAWPILAHGLGVPV